jgi:AcrR family transcriptional regulator
MFNGEPMSGQELKTEERILEAAGNIFGNKGFKDTTIRAIAQTANVNIAAVNYHFRDKMGLYGAVLEDVFRAGFSRFPGQSEQDLASTPEQRLRTFIQAMFLRLQSAEGWGGFSGKGRLIARELLDPSPAFEPVLERYIRPHKDLLVSVIKDILQIDPGTQTLLSCAISIIGQCIYYSFASNVITKISVENKPTEENIERLADFVWSFSLGGIARIREDLTISGEEQR